MLKERKLVTYLCSDDSVFSVDRLKTLQVKYPTIGKLNMGFQRLIIAKLISGIGTDTTNKISKNIRKCDGR